MYFVFQLHFLYSNLFEIQNGLNRFLHSFRDIIIHFAKRNRLYYTSLETLLLSKANAHFGTK